MRSRFYFFAFWFVMIAEFVDRGDFVFALVCFVVVAMNVFMEIFPTPRDFTEWRKSLGRGRE